MTLNVMTKGGTTLKDGIGLNVVLVKYSGIQRLKKNKWPKRS